MLTLLAIETSCDETAAAVVRDGAILSSVVSSQATLHAPYGGVVPEVASRQHILSIEQVVRDVIAQTPGGWRDIDAIAATGFLGTAKALMVRLGVPVGPARLPLQNPSAEQIDALMVRLLDIGFEEWGAKPLPAALGELVTA